MSHCPLGRNRNLLVSYFLQLGAMDALSWLVLGSTYLRQRDAIHGSSPPDRARYSTLYSASLRGLPVASRSVWGGRRSLPRTHGQKAGREFRVCIFKDMEFPDEMACKSATLFH